MRAKLPFRISSVILFLFALGHTAGFLSFRPVSPEAIGVLESMRQVRIDFGGKTVHWFDLYTGFGSGHLGVRFRRDCDGVALEHRDGRRDTTGPHHRLAAMRYAGCEHNSQSPLLRDGPGLFFTPLRGDAGLGCDSA